MIKAIETEYKGRRFRSRLEARWAVLFDNLGIKWIYEPEGFILENNIKYLPDFYLPDLDIWVEVKGVLNELDEKKIIAFVSTGKEVWLVKNIPESDQDQNISEYDFIMYKGEEDYGVGSDYPYLPCVCPLCGKVGVEYSGRGMRVCNGKHLKFIKKYGYTELFCLQHQIYIDENGKAVGMKYPNFVDGRLDDKGYSFGSPIVQNAIKMANSSRYEWGEKG